MQLTCPRCSERFSLESAVEDESGRALMALLGRRGGLARELVAYLGLFRPRAQALRWSRALALAEDVEQLAAGHGEAVVARALRETVDALRPKMGPGWKPLTNHNYLKRVLESVIARPNTALTAVQQDGNTAAPASPKSKTAQALDLLARYPSPEGIPEWFTRTVCGSLAELIVMSMEGMPAYDTLPLVVERWLAELWPKREWKKSCRFRGAKRLRTAFIQAAGHAGRWPSIQDVLDGVPRV